MEGADDTGEDTPSDGLASPVGAGDWAKLRREVFDAFMMRKLCGPDEPLVKIGRFDGLRWLGQGGFGTVFLASDPKLDRLVALKLCRRRSERLNASIEAEARALAKLEHPHIVPVFEPGEHDGWTFFAMQYIEGGDAHKFGRRVPPPSWRQVVDLYRRIARALAFAHEQGVTHGDIKPSNILIDRRGFPYLADFGLARIVVRNVPESERDGLRREAGTLTYMAPEVLDGELGDERSDQFSLCVSILHTLLGTSPFCGDTSGQVLADIEEFLADTLELVEMAALRGVLRKGLAMDPRERFASVDELADALDRLVEPVPPMASPKPEPEPEHEGEPESADGSESTTPVPDAELEPEPLPEREPESPHGSEATTTLSDAAPARALEPEAIAEPLPDQPELTPDQPELTPLGGGPAPRKTPRRVLSASLLLAVGLTLGWLGRAGVDAPRPVPSIGERKIPAPDHRVLASYSHALLAIDRGDVRAGYDAWLSAQSDVSHSPRLDGELSLLLAKRVDERDPGSAVAHAVATWMAIGAADSFERAQSWRRAAQARHVAAEFARAANDEQQAAYQERCALVNAMGRRC